MNTIAKNIKAVRELRNFTQKYVAERLRMSVANYSNIECAKTNVTISGLKEIAKILEVDCQQILDLKTDQLLNNNANVNVINVQEGSHDALLKQLQIKDEQILRLSLLLEKAMGK